MLNATALEPAMIARLQAVCPTGAIGSAPFSLDMGRCLFCGECARIAPRNIRFTNDYRTASATRQGLIITPDDAAAPHFDHSAVPYFDHAAVRPEIKSLFRKSLHLRQISAGGNNGCEMELGAAGNVNFDMNRLGIEFVASPRHADGIVITGPITRNMADAIEATLGAVPHPRVIIAVGTDAISGGLFAESPAVDRTFFDRHHVDLYVPGNPSHPMSFIWGVTRLIET